MDVSDEKYAEAATVGMKIIGAVVAAVTFKWLINIFRGPDKKLNEKEFKNLMAVIFFVTAGAWMIWKEGERTDLSHEVYGMGYLSIVFGALLVVLHLDNALDKIVQIIQALAVLRRGGVVTAEQKTEVTQSTSVSQEPTKTTGN